MVIPGYPYSYSMKTQKVPFGVDGKRFPQLVHLSDSAKAEWSSRAASVVLKGRVGRWFPNGVNSSK